MKSNDRVTRAVKEYLQNYATTLHITPEKMADLIGFEQYNYKKLMDGQVILPAWQLIQIKESLGITFEDLLGGKR